MYAIDDQGHRFVDMFGNRKLSYDEGEDEKEDDLLSESSRTSRIRTPSVAQFSQYYRDSTMQGMQR